MTDDIEHLVQRLQQEGEKSLEFFRGLPLPAWDTQVYSTGSNWRVRDILAHLTSAEHGFQALIEDILGGGRGAPLGFDIDQFNEAEVGGLLDQPVEALLRTFDESRASTIGLARRLRPEDLARRGRHPWFGETEIGDMLKLIHRHNQLHQRDIRKVLSTGMPLPAESRIAPPGNERDDGRA